MDIGHPRVKYRTETRTAVFQGKSITVESLTPVFTPEQRDQRKREIEGRLYGIFKKYAANPERNRQTI